MNSIEKLQEESDKAFLRSSGISIVIETLVEMVLQERPLGPKQLCNVIKNAHRKVENRVFQQYCREFEQFAEELALRGFPANSAKQFTFARPFPNGTLDDLFPNGSQIVVSAHNYDFFLKLVHDTTNSAREMTSWPLSPLLHLTGNYEPIVSVLEAIPKNMDPKVFELLGLMCCVPFNGVLHPVFPNRPIHDKLKIDELEAYCHVAKEHLRYLRRGGVSPRPPTSGSPSGVRHSTGGVPRGEGAPRSEPQAAVATQPSPTAAPAAAELAPGLSPMKIVGSSTFNASLSTSRNALLTAQVAAALAPLSTTTPASAKGFRFKDIVGALDVLSTSNMPGGLLVSRNDFDICGLRYALMARETNGLVRDLIPHGKSIPVAFADVRSFVTFARDAIEYWNSDEGKRNSTQLPYRTLYSNQHKLLESRSFSETDLRNLKLTFSIETDSGTVELAPQGSRTTVATVRLDEYVLLLGDALSRPWPAAKLEKAARSLDSNESDSFGRATQSPPPMVSLVGMSPNQSHADGSVAHPTNERKFWNMMTALRGVIKAGGGMGKVPPTLCFALRIGKREVELVENGGLIKVTTPELLEQFCEAVESKRELIHLAYVNEDQSSVTSDPRNKSFSGSTSSKSASRTALVIPANPEAFNRSTAEYSVTDSGVREELTRFRDQLSALETSQLTPEDWSRLKFKWKISIAKGNSWELIPEGRSKLVSFEEKATFFAMCHRRIDELLGTVVVTTAEIYSPKHFVMDLFAPAQLMNVKS